MDKGESKLKIKIFIIFIIGILVGAGAVYFIGPGTGEAESTTQEMEGQLYSCGMHPEVISDKPGNCPICGMKLTPIKNSVGAQKGETGKERKIIYWKAPMDATEIYDRPGKSKMGMDLVPVYEGEEAGGAGSIQIDGTVQQNMNLRLSQVERKDIALVIRAFGKVTFAQDKQYSVNTKFQGWIEKLYVNTTGEKVRRGQPLLAIYSPELVSTQEEYLLALKNQKKLSSSPFENIRESAVKMLQMARNRLMYWDISDEEIKKIETTGKARRTVILRSKISGVVTHKAVKEGDKVGPGMDLYHIADLNTVWVEATVYESELPFVKEGQAADLELDYFQDVKLRGKVDFIYPYLDRRSRANNIRLVFDNPDLALKPEMSAIVKIHSPVASQALAVPTESVIHSGERKIIFVAGGEGKFEPREVKTGAETDDGFVQIITGLFEGEQVVISGQFLLDSESQTREAIAKMRAATSQGKEQTGERKEQAETHSHEIAPHKNELPQGHDGHEHKAAQALPSQLYICPMHPEFLTTDPDAICPDCEMDVIKLSEYDGMIDLSKLEFYTCSMHPEFLTTDKDGRCPDCGMKLDKVKK